MRSKKAIKPTERFVYVMLSRTSSKFGRLIRLVSGAHYNHASISFDPALKELYSFGRRQNEFPVDGGLVKEYPQRFSLNRLDYVNVRIYRIPVTEQQYKKGKELLNSIKNDGRYMYNLYSALSYPVLHGFETYKAYTCAEFVAFMLKSMDIPLSDSRRACAFLPDDVGRSLDAPVFFEGNLFEYDVRKNCDTGTFFDKRSRVFVAALSLVILAKLAYRKAYYSR